jgi:adenosylmethionine-8-amino-7-oxononanoate aminotransferase
MNLSQRDNEVIWHPFTQHKFANNPLPLIKGKGAYLYDSHNNSYLDLISSWWVNLHGHSHPEIAKAIYEQAMQLEHVIFSGFTHEPAVQLAERLLKLLPNHFKKIFYSDNGSTAVEVALKMAFQYWRNLGESKRQRFIAFEQGYHGDTFGAMAMGKKSGFFSQFESLLFPVDMFPYPATFLNDSDAEQKEALILEKIAAHLKEVGHETAAIIIEPLVQGAGGMQMCAPRFLKALEKLMRQHGILIIYDEVMTGFGRTGHYFACLKSETSPDIICLAKGITGGFLPLAVTACSETIYASFLGNSFASALAHGHSFTANPLGCAAALMSLEILQRQETLDRIKMIERTHSYYLEELARHASVSQVRYCGTIAAFNMKVEMQYGSNNSVDLRERFLKSGLLIRPLGNVIYLLPPYCIDEPELKRAYEIVINEIQGVYA